MANPHPQSRDPNGIAPHFDQQSYPQGYPPPVYTQPNPHQNGYQQQEGSKPFALSEALPYTPFTSVFPFEPDIISNPSIGSGPLAPSLAGFVSREDYDALNKEAENSTHSKRVEGSLEFVQHLLKADKITQFKFKTTPKVTSPTNKPKSITDGISPFARMVYDNTSIAFRYSTPDATNASTPNGNNMSPRVTKKTSPKARKQETPKVVKHNPATSNLQAVSNNKSRIEVRIPTRRELDAAASIYSSKMPTAPSPSPAAEAQSQTVSLADLMVTPKPPDLPVPQIPQTPSSAKIRPQTPQATVLKTETLEASGQISDLAPQNYSTPSLNPPRSSGITVELPAASFDRNEYAVVADSPDTPTHLSSKRKTTSHGEFEDPLGGELNQRELANAAFADLRKCFQEIFIAEDYLSNEHSLASNLVTVTNEQEPTMTIAAHDKAQRQITRAISLGCFRQAPVDDLLRIQSLSEGSLKHADTLDFKLDETWGETEVGFWIQQLYAIELGLRATRTSLRIMCGGREEKQLYSEDVIQRGLNLFRNVMGDIIIPIAELRSTGPTSNLFRLLTTHKKVISTLFTTCHKVFSLMSDLIASVDLSETVVNILEFVASRLIFVENAHVERESVVGLQKFDALRLVAMNILSQIFLMNPAQREGIFNEILTSLEKLPVSKQSARQFKLSEGKSIQPVSALIMRLIQASAGKVDDWREKSRGRMMETIAEDDGSGGFPNGVGSKTETSYTIRTEDHAATQHSTAMQELQTLTKPLADDACRNASYVVGFIVKRALKSTKSGDTPYRNLLDLFIEDFTTCLDSPDWPAAEPLLRLTMYMMVQQVDGDKNAAPARNMALELLGVMAAAISRLRSHVRKTATNFDGSDSDELGRWLADLTLNVLDGNMSKEKTVSWLGPYRVVLEYLQDRLSDDPYLKGAISYLITDWGSQVNGEDSSISDDSEERNPEFGRIAFRLRCMVEDPKWLSREYSFKSVVSSYAKLSYSIILLRSNFCTQFKNILNILMGSMTTDQATVRSRSLKSINLVLDTDPTILDGDSVFIQLILQCSNDPSPQVRDSALGLIGKCMSMRPSLEEKMTPTVIQRFIDSGIGVRKRAMKLAKDIYLGNTSKIVRSTIANGLLLRTQDPDEGVRELARQMIEEVWISPFYKDDDSIAFKQSLTDHVALMVQTVKQGNTAAVLDKVFQTILLPDSKLAEANSRVCARLVANLVDLIGSPESDDPSIPSSKDAFQVLTIFAKADPKLFTFEQIRQLEPHISSVSTVSTNEELAVSRAVAVIYRRVLPRVSSVHSKFLADVRKVLMPATSKVTRALLDDVVACLWIISDLLQTSEPLARLALSCLKGIQLMRGKDQLDRTKIRQFDRYSLIVGMVGKHCNLDSHEERFKSEPSLPKWKGSVSKLMVDVLVPFANPSQPEDVRRPALDAIGLVCQSNPRNYVSANVYTTFQQAFDERAPTLESTILRSFKEFLLVEEQRSEQAASSATNSKESGKKDLKVMGSTSFDDVASATTQRFLKDITRITLASYDEHAFLAMEVLASINRQGLVHPKETGVTLITLETCPVSRISELAYHEHRALHEKYESVLEREYAKAIQSAFQYQRDIIKDPRGATEQSFTSKLHLLIEVLKISKSKNRVRFLEKLVGQVEFDPVKSSSDQTATSSQVAFSRFIIENLAFFEFVTVGELQATISAMEKLVTRTGSGIAQTVEAEIFQVRMDQLSTSEQPAGSEERPAIDMPPAIDTQRLFQLAAGSVILLALWEVRTYLRRLYGLSSSRRENTKGKVATKDLTKAPVKVQGVTGDKLWDDISRIMSSLDTPEHMMEQCRAFVELLNVDNEVKVPDEGEELDLDGGPTSPDADDDENATEPEQRGRKRKAGGVSGGRKKRPRSSSKPRGRGRPRKQSTEATEVDLDGDMEWI